MTQNAGRWLRWLLQLAGVDAALSYGLLTQLWAAGAGMVTVVLVARNLSEAQQGYFYTFRSLVALQVFFELGLTTVLSTFFSHEFVGLRWTERGSIAGDELRRQRLDDFLRRSVRWFLAASVLFTLLLVPFGLAFLTNRHAAAGFAWHGAWLAAVLAAALFLLVTPFIALIMGSGDVRTANAIWFWGAVAGALIGWGCLVTGHGLAAVGALNLGNAGVAFGYLAARKPRLLARAAGMVRSGSRAAANSISWRSEVWPMQWRIAVSWLSFYFVYQLFVPVLYRFQGAVVAGKMGMTLSVSNALLQMGMVWITVKYPAMAMLTANRDWRQLDHVFLRMTARALAAVTAGAIVGVAAVSRLGALHSHLAERMLPARDVGVLCAVMVLQVAMNAFGAYLRAHKREPLMAAAVIGALLQAGITVVLARQYPVSTLLAATLGLTLAYGLPVVAGVFFVCRRRWHTPKLQASAAV